MTGEARYLVRLCKDFLAEKISVDKFVERYQVYFEDNQTRLKKVEFDILDEVYMACEYYQPDEAIREVESRLLDKEELRQIVKREISKLKCQ